MFNNGQWTIGTGQSRVTVDFGRSGDIPVVGDWDGDGDDDIGVRRGTRWLLDPGGNASLIDFDFGRAGDTPNVGDWDGDGRDDVGVIRGRTWIRRPGLADRGAELPRLLFVGDGENLVGDWDGDGIDQPGQHSSGQVNLDGKLSDLDARIDPNLPLEETVQRCVSTGEQRYYRGELRAVNNGGNQRTVNAVSVEWYLRAVVPREMPATWALLGDGAGAQALEAQSVSARSYALGENRTSYARTCDTISCQVYDGRATRINGQLSSNEHPLSNTAIAETTGVVRFRDGRVARTEFSSSSGGWTAGGVFPAVEDRGDGVSNNPNHDWDNVVQISTLESRFGGRSLDAVFVSERNGLGEDGGRVLEVTLRFGAETFTMSGNDFRFINGLRSDWFSIDWERDGTRITDSSGVTIIDPPSNIDMNSIQSDSTTHVIEEGCTVLDRDVEVTRSRNGSFTTLANQRSTIRAGTSICSYYVSADRASNGRLRGSLTFSSEILGIIYFGPEVLDSHFLGVPGTSYPQSLAAFLEGRPDKIVLTDNSVSWNAQMGGAFSDAMRVIVAG